MSIWQIKTSSAQIVLSAAPFLIIGALLYAAFFIKPSVEGNLGREAPMSPRDLVFGITATNEKSYIAVGNFGKIWKSTDFSNWEALPSPVAETLQAVAKWPNGSMVAVGNKGVVVVSQDGNKWIESKAPQSQISNKLMHVSTHGELGALAVGEGSVVIQTTDQGNTWVRISDEEDVTWNDVAVIGETAVIVGEFGRIRSRQLNEKQASWKNISSPVKISLMSVAFSPSGNGVAVGLEGTILYTNNGGESWSLIPSGTKNHLFGVKWDADGWAAVGAKGEVISSADGQQWKARSPNTLVRAWHTALIHTPEQVITVGQGVSGIKW